MILEEMHLEVEGGLQALSHCIPHSLFCRAATNVHRYCADVIGIVPSRAQGPKIFYHETHQARVHLDQ